MGSRERRRSGCRPTARRADGHAWPVVHRARRRGRRRLRAGWRPPSRRRRPARPRPSSPAMPAAARPGHPSRRRPADVRPRPPPQPRQAFPRSRPPRGAALESAPTGSLPPPARGRLALPGAAPPNRSDAPLGEVQPPIIFGVSAPPPFTRTARAEQHRPRCLDVASWPVGRRKYTKPADSVPQSSSHARLCSTRFGVAHTRTALLISLSCKRMFGF